MSNRNTQRGTNNVASGNDHIAVQVADHVTSRTESSSDSTTPKPEHIRLGDATVGVQADEIHGDVTIRM